MNFTKIIKVLLLLAIISITIETKAQANKNNEKYYKDSLESSYMLEGIKDYNLGNFDKAVKNLKQLIEINPKNDVGYYYLANCALKQGNAELGETYLRKSINIDSTNFWYQDMLAQLLLQTKKVKEATDLYENLLIKFPKKRNVYYSLANIYMGNNDIENTKKILKKIETIQGKSEAIALTYLNIYRMEEKLEEAIDYLTKFDDEQPSQRIECIIGDLYTDTFNDSLAVRYYNKALEKDSKYIPALYGIAEIQRRNGDYKKYFKIINSIFSDINTPAITKIEYIQQLFKNTNIPQKYKEEIDTLMYTLNRTHPKDSNSTFLVAGYFAQRGEIQKCLDLLKTNSNNYPDNFNVFFQYIIIIYQQEDWDKLEKEAINGLKKFPNNPDLIQLIGLAQAKKGNYNASFDTYKKLERLALQKKDTSMLVTAYALLGDVSHETSNNKQAYSYYKKALKLNPNEVTILNNYAYYLSVEKKQLKKAYKMSKKSVELEPDNPTYLDTFGWILFLMNKPIEAKAQFKHAMLYGGKESAVILDHYAEVLFKLKEYDLAFIYWDKAKNMDKNLGIEEKIIQRKKSLNN